MQLKQIIVFLCSLIITFSSAARDFENCKANSLGRTELDNVCPRLEGVHLEGCCPQMFKSNDGIQCTYHIVEKKGQPVLINSSYTQCVNGSNVNVPCCTVARETCLTSPIEKKFIQRLINRDNTCCFENCPPPKYWMDPPNPDSQFTNKHELTNESPIPICINQTIDKCSNGNSANCQASNRCPVQVTPGPSTPAPPSPGKPGKPGTPNPSPPDKPNPPKPPPNPPKPPVSGGAV